MASTRDALVDRVQAGGFDYLGDVEVARFVEEAALEITQAENWLWRRQVVTYAAQALAGGILSGQVEHVSPTANPREELLPERETELRDRYGDLTVTGTPRFYYLREQQIEAAAAPEYDTRVQLHTYPVMASTDELTVTFFSELPWSTLTADQLQGAVEDPVASSLFAGPERFESMIVLLARMKCKEHTDGWEDYGALQAVYDRGMAALLNTYLWRQVDEPDQVRVEEGF